MNIRKIAFVACIFLIVKFSWDIYMYEFSRYYSKDFSGLLRITLDLPLAYFLFCFWRNKPESQEGKVSAPEHEADGRIWLYASVAPIGLIVLGYVIALGMPHNQNDWIGLSYVLPVFLSLFIGGILSVILAYISFRKKERNAAWSLLSAFPASVGLFWAVSELIRTLVQR